MIGDSARHVTDLARRLRAAGLVVSPAQAGLATRALTQIEVTSEVQVLHALRACLCRGPRDVEVLDAVFFGWGVVDPSAPERQPDQRDLRIAEEADGSSTETSLGRRWSAQQSNWQTDFSTMDEADRRRAELLAVQLGRRRPARPSRRRKRVARRSGAFAGRATMRSAMRTAGEPLVIGRTIRGERPRRQIFVCDASGSMEHYTRMVLHFVAGAVLAASDVEAFVFGTSLTRVTPLLRRGRPEDSVNLALQAAGVGSGTRIGESLSELNRRCGGFLGRGADVFILSDGWDRGDAVIMEREVAHLRRCAHRLVWLNPLSGDPEYQPLTRGMRIALPHLDHLLPANSLAALAALIELSTDGGTR